MSLKLRVATVYPNCSFIPNFLGYILGYTPHLDNFHRLLANLAYLRAACVCAVLLAALVSPLHTRATQLDSDTLPSWDCFSEQINSLRDHMTALAIARLTQRAWDHALAFEYDAAIDTASHAITLAPDDPAPYVLRGQMILLLYEWDRALADFDQAIMLDRKSVV